MPPAGAVSQSSVARQRSQRAQAIWSPDYLRQMITALRWRLGW